MSKPKSLSARVDDSRDRLKARGGRRMPGGMLRPEANRALQSLLRSGYADSMAECIARALIEADERRQ